MINNLKAIIINFEESGILEINKPKLNEKICGQELILYPIEVLKELDVEYCLVLNKNEKQLFEVIQKNKSLNDTVIVECDTALGSGYSVLQTSKYWDTENLLILNGNLPLLKAEVIVKLYNKHKNTDADISFLTAHVDTENSFCKIVVNNDKISIVNNLDCEFNSPSNCCVSSGIYIVKKTFLEKNINKLTKSEITGAYYFSEFIKIASENDGKIVTSEINFELIRAVTSFADLWAVEHIKRSQLIKKFMARGVRFINTFTVVIDKDIEIETGACIESGVHLLGNTKIEENVIIKAFSIIENSVIEQNSCIGKYNIISNSIINKNSNTKDFYFLENNLQKKLNFENYRNKNLEI